MNKTEHIVNSSHDETTVDGNKSSAKTGDTVEGFAPSCIDTESSSDNKLMLEDSLSETNSSDIQNVCHQHPNKRRKIHMDSMACFQHADSEEGKKPLVDPVLRTSQMRRNLQPFNRKRHNNNQINTEAESQMSLNNPFSQKLAVNSSQGFVSAADMYKVSKTHKDVKPPVSSFENNSKSKKNSFNRKAPNQSSILTFMKEKTVKSDQLNITPNHIGERSSVGSTGSQSMDTPPKSTKTSPSSEKSSKSPNMVCTMYSPIKRLGDSNVIYISDSSPSCSPSSSQGSSSATADKLNYTNNPVIKQLFSAQKNMDKQMAHKRNNTKGKPSQTKTKKEFVNKKELSSLKEEAAKYFENDSFDMNAAFASDSEDFTDVQYSKKKDTQFDKYGLLGTGNYPKASPAENHTGINYFETLPLEVLENIFCCLPMLDLCLNSNRVCSQWNEIIADKKFLPWKKMYHKLKKDVGSSRQDIQCIMNKNGMTSASTFLVGLIRYMKGFKPVTAVNMLDCLKKHSRYKWAKDLIDERLPDCIVHEEPNPWSLITTLVIVSDDVYTIQEIISCLTVSLSQCTSIEIIECLYCIATFLYAFKLAKRADVWNGMHYRLFYALYLYENAFSSSCADLKSLEGSNKGQQSLIKYSSSSDSVRLTHEQLRIVKHQPGDKEVIKIVAFAGTGKTTTLVKYTQLRPNKNFILVVYNKSVREYAQTKFPKNVTCKTGHALAFQTFGRRYSSKLYGIKVYTLTQTLKMKKGENLFIRAKNVLTTLENYFASADYTITMQHVPSTRICDKTGRPVAIEPSSKMGYVEDALYIWGRMKDLDDKKVGMTHDGYLKMYQLSRPRLSQYDCILIDEAQDLTPAITDILLNQPQGKILVGDPHQQIYSFRGAINAMDTIRADTIFYLTQSFRFGPEIAQVAASCLEILKHEKKKTLVGSGKKCTVLGEKVGQLAIISRCNFTVFSEATKKCCYSEEPCKVAFVGGTDNFGFPMMMDMYALTLPPHEREKEGYEVQHKLIKMFSTFAELENFATKSMDKELLGKIKIVKTYHHNLPTIVNKIQSKCVRDERQADYVFSTAHKAKGLEFSTVRVTDDFLSDHQPHSALNFDLDEFDQPIIQINMPIRLGEGDTDEGNLLYVAVTRAKNALQMSSTLMRILNQAGEKFEFPVYSEDLRQAGKTFKCIETDQEFKPTALTLQRKSITRGDGVTLADQLYSPAYLSEDFGSFSKLMGLKEEMEKEAEKRKPAIAVNAFYVG